LPVGPAAGGYPAPVGEPEKREPEEQQMRRAPGRPPGRARAAAAAALTAGAGAAAATAALRAAAARRRRRGRGDRWLVVTIGRPAEDVLPGGTLPEPLARLGVDLEVTVRPAPGDRGSELAVLPRDGRRDEVRAALRDVKCLLETGEVVVPDRPPTTRPTVPGRVFDAVRRRAAKEGVL
jgi:hypothetical protein